MWTARTYFFTIIVTRGSDEGDGWTLASTQLLGPCQSSPKPRWKKCLKITWWVFLLSSKDNILWFYKGILFSIVLILRFAGAQDSWWTWWYLTMTFDFPCAVSCGTQTIIMFLDSDLYMYNIHKGDHWTKLTKAFHFPGGETVSMVIQWHFHLSWALCCFFV